MGKDSFLAYLLKSGRGEAVSPHLLERLAVEDVVMPSLRNTQKLADYLAGLKGKLFPFQPISLKRAATKHPATWAERVSNKLSRGGEVTNVMESIYGGLTLSEANDAWKILSSRSEVVTKQNHPELHEMFGAALKKGKMHERPRLILHHSDIPYATKKRFPGCTPYVGISTNYREILNDLKLEGILLHEISHLHDNSNILKGVGNVYRDAALELGNFQRSAEYRADFFAAKALGDPEAILQIEVIERDREAELKKFAQDAMRAFHDSKTPLTEVWPIWPSLIEGYAKADLRAVPKSTTKARWVDSYAHAHPTKLERMDAITKAFAERTCKDM